MMLCNDMLRAQQYPNLKFISNLVVIFGVPVSASIALILYKKHVLHA